MNKSLTLLELIISITIISLIVLGFTSLDLYSRHNVLLAARRTKIQNAISYTLDHMTKEIGKAIGDRGNVPITRYAISGDSAIEIRVDSNNNGELDGGDKQIAYSYNDASHELRYHSDYSIPDTYEVLSNNIDIGDLDTSVTYSDTNNYIDITLIGRWDPTVGSSQDNPEITMLTRVKMFGVSTN